MGGAERLVTDLVENISDNHSEFEINLILLNGVNTPLLEEIIENPSIKTHILGNSLFSPIILFKLIKHMRKADIVHLHLFPTLYWGVLSHILSFSKAKLIFTEHSTNNNRRGKIVFKVLDKLVYRRLHRIVCISESTRINLLKQIGEKFNDKITIINNGINLDFFKNSISFERGEFGYGNEDFIVIQVASFRPAKDQFTVIKALNNLPDNTRLLFIGTGPNMKECRDLVDNLGLGLKVQFLGNRSDVPRFLKMSDVVVVSSNYEGFGIVAVEGMACGKPVIASDVPGLNEVVRNYGILFARGDDRELAEQILHLMCDPLKYNNVSFNCLRRSDDFSLEMVSNCYKKIYL